MAYQGKTIENKLIGQQLRFIRTSSETNGELLEIENTYPGRSREPIGHYHPFQEEWFEVLSGELTVKLDNRVNIFKQGEKIYIPKNQVHSMWNDSEEKTVVNWIIKPALSTEHFFEISYGLAKDGKVNKYGMPHFLQSVLLVNKFSKEYRLAKPPYYILKIIFSCLTPLAKLLGYRSEYQKYLN